MQDKSNNEGDFFANLRYLVNETGLKDYEIAERLGIHRVTFARYFSEGKIPGKTILQKIAKYFGVEVDALLHGNLLPSRSYNNYSELEDTEESALREIFADRLSLMMLKNRIRQTNLASATGISQSVISKYMNAKGLPKLSDALKLARELNVSVDWLTGGDPDSSDSATEVAKLKLKIEIVTEMLRGALKQIETK